MRKVFILSILSVVIVFGFAKRNYLNGRFKSGLTKPVNCKNCDIEFNEKNSIHILATKNSSLHSPIKKEIGIRKYLKNKSLVPLKDGEGYIIDKMSYSYPFLTAKTISFIEALGMEFKTACELSHLRCRPFIITSALRTKETVNKLQKINPNGAFENTTRLKHMITSINGKSDQASIREFVDEYLLAPDSRAFKQYYNEISPDIDTTVTIDKDGYVQEGVVVQIDVNFFWPDA
jgi:hypothetical protein